MQVGIMGNAIFTSVYCKSLREIKTGCWEWVYALKEIYTLD